jgi:hypothetical protein
MHMIPLHIQFNHFTPRIPADRLYSHFSGFSQRSVQYAVSIFRNPNNMILTMPYGV